MALGCGLVASVAISQVLLDQKKGAPEVAMVDVLVAVKDIYTPGKLTAENVKSEKWPKDRVPVGAIIDFKEVDGKYANQSIFQGEPIVKKKLINAVDSLAITIPKGYKLFDLPINGNHNDINYIKPGDRVDIFGFFEKGGRIPETKTSLIVENVTVKAVDGNAVRDNGEQGSGKSIKSIQLLIRDTQYEAVNTAVNLGKLRVALRPPSEDDQVDESQNGEAFLTWIKTVEKMSDSPTAGSSPKTPIDPSAFAIQPAPKDDATREMLVISPSGFSKYRWGDAGGLPELVSPDSKAAPAQAGNQMVSGVQPGNMIWNPTSGSWTTSGFAPTYPGADGSAPAKGKGDIKDPKDSKDGNVDRSE